MKRILLLSMVFSFVLATTAWAQRTVSGKVTDENGEGLPGVNVVIKGTTTGVTTDLDGNFQITVPDDNTVLVFSSVGMATQEVVVGARSIIDLGMSLDTKQLQEVVVTGYGVETKRDLTGSIANVKAEELANTQLQSFDRALQGRAPGVLVQSATGQPGGAVNIVVRGQGSLANNTPLYIIDGVQMGTSSFSGQGSSNPLAGINPNDIESIEILKDAAAAAIYGAQSANGVVIITTKRGKLNSSSFEVSYQRGVVKPIGLYDVMNAEQLAEMRIEAVTNAGGDLGPVIAAFGDPEDPSSFTPYDWVDAVFRDNSALEIVNVRLSGGTDRTTFYVAASTESQEGQVVNSEWERQTLRTRIDHNVNEKFKFGSGMSLSRQRFFGTIDNGNFVNGPFVATYAAQPNSPARDENGNFNPYPTHGQHSALFGYNILQGIHRERREAYSVQAVVNMDASYKITDYLTIAGMAGVDYVDSRSHNERPATASVLFAPYGGSALQDDRQAINWNANTTLNFAQTFATNHNVSALIGAEWKEDIFSTFSASKRGFGNPALRQLSDAVTLFSIDGSLTGFQRFGAFSRLGYNYKNKYYINGTLRRDGNSKFGDQVRFGTFWSVGGSWRVIEEGFMSGISFLDDLKLRFSYGELGNANGIGDFEAISAYTASRQYLGGTGQVLAIANDQLTWERSLQKNIGVDLGVWGNRLTVSVDWYRNDTEDQLFSIPVTDDSGYTGVTGNIGSVRNSGVEVAVSSVNFDAGGFTWTSRFNISFQKNEVTSLPDGQDTLFVGTTPSLIVGQPVDFTWGVNYVGVNPANGRPMWRAADGSLSYGNLGASDGYVIGSPIPASYGGFSNTFTYKGLTLDVFFQFQLGAEAFNSDLYNLRYSASGNDNQLVDELDRWQQPGDLTNVPRAYDGGQIDGYDLQFPGLAPSRYMSDASYIRLKQITLSYDIPSSILEKTKALKGANIFVMATNLITWTKYDGIDPEVTTQNNSVGASAYGNYPVGKQVSGGVTLKF